MPLLRNEAAVRLPRRARGQVRGPHQSVPHLQALHPAQRYLLTRDIGMIRSYLLRFVLTFFQRLPRIRSNVPRIRLHPRGRCPALLLLALSSREAILCSSAKSTCVFLVRSTRRAQYLSQVRGSFPGLRRAPGAHAHHALRGRCCGANEGGREAGRVDHLTDLTICTNGIFEAVNKTVYVLMK